MCRFRARKAGADRVFTSEGELALTMTEAVLRQIHATPEQADRERRRMHAELFGEPTDLERPLHDARILQIFVAVMRFKHMRRARSEILRPGAGNVGVPSCSYQQLSQRIGCQPMRNPVADGVRP